MTAGERVLLEARSGVGVVTLNDPDRRNALSVALVDELCAALDQLETDDATSVVVITGAGPAFCAGAALSHLGDADDDEREEALRSIYECFLRVARSPLVTLAAVNGPAVGAGMNLALACDVRVAARSARFDTRFLALGIHPGGGHTWWLQRLLGAQGAAAMVLCGEVLDGESAQRRGLAWSCVDDGEELAEARRLAGQVASAPAPLVARTKATLRATADAADHSEALETELAGQLWSMAQPAFGERLAAARRRITRATP